MTTGSGSTTRPHWLTWYYLVTPLFALADRVLGVSIRASFLDTLPGARYGYYAVCCACGVWAWRAPAMARRIAVVESGANIVLLIFAVMLSYYAMIDQVLADQPIQAGALAPEHLVNLVLSASMFSLAYFRTVRAAER